MGGCSCLTISTSSFRLHEAGVVGFKCFLADSGLKEFPRVDADGDAGGPAPCSSWVCPLIVHAENDLARGRFPSCTAGSIADYLASRPVGIENLAIAQVIEAARRTGGHAHICHLSSSDALPMIESARRDGVHLTVESCPHYLALCAEEIEDGATYFKCCPPIREAANREMLWDGLGAGLIDLVVSDHSPSTPELKNIGNGDFGAAWGGIASVQLTLPVVWTQARARGFSLAQVCGWMSSGPARLVGLQHKGGISVGNDADFCVFAPEDSFVVDPGKLHHKNPGTPYDGRELFGVVRSTILHGDRVDLEAPRGRLLMRGAQ